MRRKTVEWVVKVTYKVTNELLIAGETREDAYERAFEEHDEMMKASINQHKVTDLEVEVLHVNPQN